jgi:signal transduction histidine kinase
MKASVINSLRPSEGRATSSSVRLPAFVRTVRFRLSFWYSSLLLVFGVAFVLALNVAVRLDQPDAMATITFEEGIQWEPVRSGPGQAISGFTPVLTPRAVIQQAESEWYSQNLDRLRTWSIVAVVGLAIASGVGGYVLSGMMLRPVRDITEVASAISASNLSRRINHQGPDDELRALADTFDSMIARLETSFDRQRQFVQDASHELRTPLAAIRTNIEVAELDPDVSPEEYRALLETVKSQTERLTRLSEDLLLLSTSDRETSEPEVVDASGLTREVVSQLAPLASSRDITLGWQGIEDVDVAANSDVLYRCVLNLVDNAIKYSGAGASVVVRVDLDDDEAVLQVADTGPGISEAEAARVFDRFYRVDKGRSRREGGTGLGLAIVREMVEAMGGRVSLESQVGVGSVFSIHLPASERQVLVP